MFYDFGGKMCFSVFGVKTRFCSFGMKTCFTGFAENAFWRENMFFRVSQKMRFDGKICFAVFTRISFGGKGVPVGKHVLWFWRENVFLCFGGNVFWRKNAFWRENTFL